METTLKNNIDQVHRFAFDESDYTLIHSQQMDSGETGLYFHHDTNSPAFGELNQPFNEYIVEINADAPVNFEAYGLVDADILDVEGTDFMFVWSSILTYLPQGSSSSNVSTYVGDPYDTACGFPYDYDVIDGATTAEVIDAETEDVHDAVSNFDLCFRESKTTDYDIFKIRGCELKILIGEFNNTPANFNLKVWYKELVEGAG